MTTISATRVSGTVLRNAARMRWTSGLTRKQYTEATGISPSTQHRIEQHYLSGSEYNPTLRTLVKLSSALGVTLQEFTTSTMIRPN
jgi:transcriptional regulator with XRE-family HTH domain